MDRRRGHRGREAGSLALRAVAVASLLGLGACAGSGKGMEIVWRSPIAVTSQATRLAVVQPAPIGGVGHEEDGCSVCALYDSRSESVVRVLLENSIGAGVVLSAEGDILTNAHVVAGQKIVAIETIEGTIAPGRVVRIDEAADLALVRATPGDIVWKPIDWRVDEEARIGSPIYVIGHPLGLGWTVTEGLISARRRAGEVAPIELLQTDAAISPGNSGGPVFDDRSHPVGIVRSKVVAPGAENLGFVIPWSVAREFIEADGQAPERASATPHEH